MPYVNPDGTITNTPPLAKRVQDAFWGFVDFLSLFFRTLLPLPAPNGSSSGGSGGRAVPGGPRRGGGFKTLSDCPPMPGGG